MSFLKKYIYQNFSNFTYFYSILRGRLLIVIIFSLLVGLLDSIGLTLFLPLLQLADGGGHVDLGNLNFLLDTLAYFNIDLTIYKALTCLVIIFLTKGIIMYLSSIYKLKTQQYLSKAVRVDIIDKFPTYSYNQFVKTDVGKIQNIFLGEVVRMSNTYSNYISMVQGFVMIFVYMFFSFIVDWKFAFLVCIGAFISNLVFEKLNKLTKEKSKNISTVNNKFANILLQYVNHFKYLKASGRILNYKTKVVNGIDDIQREYWHIGLLQAKVTAFREPILIVIICLVISIQLLFFDARIAGIMISLLFFYRALISIVNVQTAYNNTVANQGAIDNIQSFVHELDTNAEEVGTIEFESFKDQITLENVSFGYDNVKILDKINLTIRKNETVAFVGESGSGKTTLVNIIISLLSPQSGSIRIDGIDSKELNQFSFQNKVGYISQEPTVFNDTIYNNITFWADKTPENLAKFWSVIHKASLEQVIDHLEDRENSMLGNNGVNLSGGQRQRISIARELYKDVDLLILDEATSALDSQTEFDIQKNIDGLKGEITMVIIAHRLSTVKNVDTIVVLNNGKIQDKGAFSVLKESSAYFRNLTNLQGI